MIAVFTSSNEVVYIEHNYILEPGKSVISSFVFLYLLEKHLLSSRQIVISVFIRALSGI